MPNYSFFRIVSRLKIVYNHPDQNLNFRRLLNEYGFKFWEKIASVFSDWTALDKEHYEKEGKGAFEIFTTSQIVRFDCYGMQESDMNSLMDILIDFGCPLFDPQISTGFDGWTDR